MVDSLEISRREYLNILSNRGKPLPSSASNDKILRKIKL